MLLLKDVPSALYRGQTVSVPRHPAEAPPSTINLKFAPRDCPVPTAGCTESESSMNLG